MKNVKLILEYDIGPYSEKGHKLSKNPKDWVESFYQNYRNLDMVYIELIGVKIENIKKSKKNNYRCGQGLVG
jgi:hypothetical protein